MGCCLSSPRTQSPPRPYPASTTHSESSRAITGPGNILPRPSDTVTGPVIAEGLSSSPNANGSHNKALRRHAWKADKRWTKKQLEREREEYFDTRVSGRAEIWNAIRMAVQVMGDDLVTAQTVLDAAGVTLPTGDLVNGAYDEIGNYYHVPEYCLSDPVNVATEDDSVGPDRGGTSGIDAGSDDGVETRREEKGKGVLDERDMFMVKARLSDRGGPDIQVAMGQNQTVRQLARKVQDEASIPGGPKVRIAYLGRILDESQTLHAQGWCAGHVLNALVFQ